MQAPMTTKGAQRLRAELDELKSHKRPEVINAIAEARAHGDLKENAEYHAAREQQGFIEGRIKQLESELSNAQVMPFCFSNSLHCHSSAATMPKSSIDGRRSSEMRWIASMVRSTSEST